MDSTATTVIVSLAAAWIIQYYFAWWQMRRFYKRIADLRRTGLVSVGMSGSTWRRKQYAVLVVDKDHTITHVEELSGWTVMASLKPVAGLDGRPMSDLWDDDADLPVPPKLLLALKNAAAYIKDKTIREADAEVETAQLSESATAT
ncbi:MAG: transcriptional regulator GutM [Chloroflexi bacterium]|nr:transcriptional regulator GutM [Chloroflexota bacterium]